MAGKLLGNIVDSSGIDVLTSACRLKCCEAGNVIIKEGNIGDVFCIIEQGAVEFFKESCGKTQIRTLIVSDFFREKALISGNIRSVTCIANSHV